jgi:hypothetical protein
VRPHGYVDPHRIAVVERPIIDGDSALLVVHSGQGTSNRSYRCVARRAARDRWIAECRETQAWTSTLSPNVALQLAAAVRTQPTRQGHLLDASAVQLDPWACSRHHARVTSHLGIATL